MEGEEEVERAYARCYDAGQKGKRALGQLAQHDWKGSHRQWERAQGLVDLSDSIFEGDMAPEHDVGIVAQFLNSSLLAAFGKKAGRCMGDIGEIWGRYTGDIGET